MAGKTESLTETLAKQAEARFSASAGVEKDERTWIASLLPSHQAKCEDTSVSFHDLLKDGVILCELINHLAETNATRPSTSNLPFKQRENISSYLTACEKLGLSQTELFETSDLFESKNLQLVLQHLGALHIYVTKNSGSLKDKYEKAGSAKLSAAKRGVSKPITSEPSSSAISSGGTPPHVSKGPKSVLNSSSSSHASPTGAISSDGSAGYSNSPSKAKMPSVASLAADVATKEEFKYNPEVEAAAQRWIEKVLGLERTNLSFFQFLRSGVVLCQLANKIQPNILPHIYEGALPYRQMENIGWYIRACQQLGMRDEELFETPDLFTEGNLNAVANHIHVLAHWLVKRPEGWKGPLIENVRTAKSLFSATLVEPNWDKISQTASSSAPLTDEQKELLAWANAKLAAAAQMNLSFSGLEAPKPVEILNLSSDVQNGLKLIQLISAVCRGQTVGSYNAEPTMIWHAMQNASAILTFVTSHTFEKIEGVRAVDIVTGNVNAISKLLFYLREKFDLDYLFAQTLGTLQSSASSTTQDTGSETDTIEVEILEGEEVPAHLRPLMSIEDLQHYDRLAAERRAQEAEEAQEEEILQQQRRRESDATPKRDRTDSSSGTLQPPSDTRSTVDQRRKSTSTPSGTGAAAQKLEPHDETTEIEVVEVDPVHPASTVITLRADDKPDKIKEPKPTKRTGKTKNEDTSTTVSEPAPESPASESPSLKTEGENATPTKRPRKGKDSTASPKLKDSNDSVDSASGHSKSRGKLRREKVASNGSNTVPVEIETPSENPEPVISVESPAVEVDTISRQPSTTDTVDSVASMGSQLSLTSISSNSSTNVTPSTTPRGYTRNTSHSRDRSITRRVHVKRTATFGANVVTTDQEKVMKAQQVVRKHVATETLTTEQSYLNSLNVLIRELLEPVKRAKVLSTEEFTSLFSNLESIAQYHVKFEALLRARISTWNDNSVLADIFLNETDFFMEYGPYLENYNKAAVAMHYIRKKHPKFDQLIKNFEDEQMKTTMQSVDSFLIMPVQRLPRYRLLLSDMRKYTPPSLQENIDLDMAGRKVDEVLRELNSHISKDGAEQIRKMLNVESSIQTSDAPLSIMKLDRKFIKEGSIYVKKLKVGDKTEKKKLMERMKGLKAYVFLFNDLLVICEHLKQAKSDDKCQFALVHAYHLHDILVISEKERSEKSMDQIANFSIKHVDKKAKDLIIYLHVESDLVVIHTNSNEERDVWINAFNKRNSK